jgi:hypothetical protein
LGIFVNYETIHPEMHKFLHPLLTGRGGQPDNDGASRTGAKISQIDPEY